MTTAETKVPRPLIRPTVETPFHIDYDWWVRSGRDLDVYLRSHLCPEHQALYPEIDPNEKVDHVDPVTAEVSVIDRIQHILISHCSQQESFLTPQTSLVQAVFRVFLTNGNTPQSPAELAELTGRISPTILRTLSGPRIYKGIRPIH